MPASRSPSLALITSTASGVDPLKVPSVAATLAAWPEGGMGRAEGTGGAGASCVVLSTEALLDTEGGARLLDGVDGVFIPLAGAIPPSVLRRLVDALEVARVPGLALAEPSEVTEWAGPELLVRPEGSPPEQIAAMLYALCFRQPTLRAVQADLRLSHSLQGGAAAELDRLNDELLLAARVQREFLPKRLPEVPGVGSAVLFRPAGFVSGDIYDVVRLDEHHVGFFLADAMGHGLPAALMTLFIAGNLTMKLIGDSSYRLVEPIDALRRLNDAMFACRGGTSRIASAMCGIIDARTRRVTLATAGHPRPVRVRGGEPIPLDISGMLLGVIDTPEFDQVSFEMEPDEVLLVYSDGLECASPGMPERLLPTPDNLSRLAQCFADAGGAGGLERAMDSVAHDLDLLSGSLHQTDDITLIAVQPLATGGECGAGAGRGAVEVGA